jgi:hypothetical protein
LRSGSGRRRCSWGLRNWDGRSLRSRSLGCRGLGRLRQGLRAKISGDGQDRRTDCHHRKQPYRIDSPHSYTPMTNLKDSKQISKHYAAYRQSTTMQELFPAPRKQLHINTTHLLRQSSFPIGTLNP